MSTQVNEFGLPLIDPFTSTQDFSPVFQKPTVDACLGEQTADSTKTWVSFFWMAPYTKVSSETLFLKFQHHP